jgi:hypothetical protein
VQKFKKSSGTKGLIRVLVLQHNMDVADADHGPGYASPLTCNREGLLVEVKEEKDPLLLTLELEKENEVSCVTPLSKCCGVQTVGNDIGKSLFVVWKYSSALISTGNTLLRPTAVM